jgi:RNA polymerase-binding transcription factor DksA
VSSFAPRPELRALLEALRHDASARLEGIESSMARLRLERAVDVADDEHDPDGAALSGEWAQAVGVQEAARREISEIEAALHRWEAGTYGVCADCGRGIPIERLRIRPFAARCVPCAEKAGR